MKAALISLGSTSSIWTVEEMQKLFKEVNSVDLNKIEVSLQANKAKVLYDGSEFEHVDCVYAKGSYRYAPLLASVTSILKNGSYMPVDSSAFSIGHNKLLTHLALLEHDIPMPVTYLASTVEAARKVLKTMNYPIIMKFPEGTQGKGVMFADSFASASSLLDALTALRQPFLIQEYVETGGADVRAIVVGEKVVAAMKRISDPEEARSNIHAGGTGEPIILDAKTQSIAIKASKAVKAAICGVDILESHKGPLILEVNLSPGLQGITKATNVNVAEEIASFLYEKTVELKEGSKPKNTEEILEEMGIAQSQKVNDIITNLSFRGDKIILPELVTKLTGFKESDEFIIKAEGKKVTIEKL
jgi:ribosomal protein S6--L-glutamate ligase